MALAQSIAALFCRFGKCCSRSAKPEGDPRQEFGRRGEKAAAAWLRRNGYKILYRNFRAPNGGEVDLVAREKAAGILVFIEVKTRSGLDFGRPAEAVNAAKQRLISRGALHWLSLLGNPEIRFRFDIIEVLIAGNVEEFNLIRDTFHLAEPYRY